ncbi:hypothetical protein K461DRAFT_290132 [Myriangium duriaei CBS 260.36]|uniref:Uncharacterized protein n=1 Tax=Myriangium duriaei CBS 260.36 TaxID=1168546 RepID=A0A9P4MK54_9PEZI|nr:hypothetical protein K461DRAFT_290132 [Myriangium duriaei CBS 260.36]
MAGTRSSTRLNGSSSPQPESNKRKAEESPASKNSKKGKKVGDQMTLEEITQNEAAASPRVEDTEASNGAREANGSKKESNDNTFKAGDSFKGQNKDGESKTDPEKALKDSRGGSGLNKLEEGEKPNGAPEGVPLDDVHAHEEVPAQKEQSEEQTKGQSTGSAIEEDKQREEALPSNVLEKGIIYFFTRGRVGVEELESVQDLQRSHFVLRPIPDGGKIGDGVIDDQKNARLLALPKKVWPKSGKDRFMAFVESAKISIKDLKDDFLQGSEYQTKTLGSRQTPPVTAVGEGVYAITSTGNRGESHLAYMLTIPKEPGNLQEDIGIRSKGSFVISLKNPESKGPANASLPEKPDYPQEFIEEFRNRSWMPVEPKHLDYANAQMLLIGEDFESGHALEATKKDQQDEQKETPEEEIEKLENEDQIRIKHLKGDDTIFADLDVSKKDYPDVATTW